MRLKALLFTALGITSAFAQTNPVKMAVVARFDLLGNAATGSLTNGYMFISDASVDRQTWISAAEQPRSFTVNFTIAHFGWTEAAFRFTPASNGMVTLTIRGPWEQSPNSGPIYRQEVLWDACSATNAPLTKRKLRIALRRGALRLVPSLRRCRCADESFARTGRLALR